IPPSPPSTTLRSFLSQSLPAHMIPATFITLESLPLTPSGKIDRKALKATLSQAASQVAPPEKHTAPRTPTEELLTGIWSTVLGVKVGIQDNFFELGGHSLVATRVISQVRQVFGVEVPLRQLFEQPTIAAFASSLSSALQPPAPPIVPTVRSSNPPLSFAQQRQWFLAQLEPDSPFYNIPAAVRITGNLNLPALQRSLNQIIQRHEILRTAFSSVDGQPIQVISPDFQLDIPLLDLSALPVAVQQQQLENLADWQAKQPIRIDRLPLLRVQSMRLSDAEHGILLTLHHIIADGWSMGVLIQELATLYPAFSQNQTTSLPTSLPTLLPTSLPTSLPELTVQYVDFATWQHARQEELTTQLNYWQQQLANLPILELPTDRPRPAVRSLQGSTYRFSLSPSLTAALKQLSLQLGSTLFMTLLAAFQILLHRYTGSHDLVVGTAIANRNRAEIEGLIGFFVNMLALRTDLSGNPTFEELLHRVREVALSAYAHQDLPFEQLVDALQPQRSLSYTPLFQVMFVLQNAPFSELQMEGLQWTPMISDSGTAKFDLTLSMQETADELTGTLEYSLDLFELPTIQRLAGHLQTLLEAIVVNPEQHLSELPLLTAAEQQLLHTWNQIQTDYSTCYIHEVFESQVEQMPDAVALIYQDQQFSYLELNQKANQLAHYLRTLGATTETAVGIYLARSPAAIISILAVLKAGSTYLPLDPNLPSERLQLLIQDAQVQILISHTSHPIPHTSHPFAKSISIQTSPPSIATARIT
ncbi:MAG: AMP-binding protein, partial [Cyanobacteria bacterium CRU_2_1]|nr:AMP-binding protein [Cyanobacteria bacterium CRU_2_1]